MVRYLCLKPMSGNNTATAIFMHRCITLWGGGGGEGGFGSTVTHTRNERFSDTKNGGSFA